MVDVKQAVEIARQKAIEILGAESASLEEIDRMTYNGADAWSITLGVPRDLDLLPPLARVSASPVQYRRFLIDVSNGDFLAMRLHELALR